MENVDSKAIIPELPTGRGHNPQVPKEKGPFCPLESKLLLGHNGELSAERVKDILEKRAEVLAQNSDSGESEEESFQLLSFSLSQETYAIPINFIQEVQPVKELTPIPCTPDFVLGAVNLRGNILSVLDIRKLFNLPIQKLNPNGKIIVIEACELKIGIMSDTVQQIINVLPKQIEPAIATLSGIEQEYVQGVTGDMIIVLDIPALMKDKRIIVRKEAA